ncbi:MAG: nucleotidyl transferase AbiEii/AbiGii toxin family protein [Sporichthyaceae bacterium]
MSITAALRHSLTALGALEVPYALIGGLAVSARAEPRFTRDVALALAVDSDTAADQVVRHLLGAGFELLALIEHVEMDRLGTVRLIAPGTLGVVVDLAFASSGLEPEVVAAAGVLEILDVPEVPVAAAGHLVVMKLLARADHRPHDHGDLIALAEVLKPADVDLAATAARLVTERGFHRDRDLAALLDEYLAAFRPDLRR